jgi:hypothetical protein
LGDVKTLCDESWRDRKFEWERPCLWYRLMASKITLINNAKSKLLYCTSYHDKVEEIRKAASKDVKHNTKVGVEIDKDRER